MADNINQFTMHSFFSLPWKNNDGTIVNTSSTDERTTYVTRMSLLRFVVIDEVEATGLQMLNKIDSKLQETSSQA
eukprot:5344211-Karenia_brevis.AAC.1